MTARSAVLASKTIYTNIIKDGMAKYGIKNPIFKPSPITPTYNDYLIFESISVDEQGKQHYLDVHRDDIPG